MARIFNKVFPIYNADGTSFHNLVLRKATYESSVMSLGDKITGDVVYQDNSLEFTMGEYISFKSNFGDTQDEEVKFFLVNPPTVTREGVVSNSSDLKGATKYSLEFYHPMYMLSNFPFSDVAVSSDEKQYLSENKTFSWIGNPIDFFAKLNKNLQGTEWVVIKGSRFPQEKETELSEVLSFDKNTIADALKTCYDTWGVPFVVDSIKQGEYTYIDTHNNEVDYYDEGKRFVVLFGLPSSEIYASVEDKESDTPYIFEMGQGLGLKNNSRTPKNNKIVTRIAGYGSERNVPYGYPQIVWYGNQDWDYTINNDPNNPHSYPIYKGIVGGMYVKLIKHPFTRSHLMPSIYGETVFNKVSPYLEGNIEDVVNTITYSQWYEKANGMVEKATEEGKEGWELDLLTNLRDVTCLYTPESAESLPSAAIPTGLHTYTTDQGEATINVQESNNIVTIEVDSYWYDFTYKVVQIHKTLGGENPDYDPDLDIVDYYDAIWSEEYPYVNEINPLSPSYEAHEFEDIYPRLGEEQIVAVLPYEQEESVDYVDVATATSKLEEQEELARDRLWAHQDEATYYTNEIQAIINLIGNADVNEEKEVEVYKKMWFTNKSTQVDIITWKITSDGYFNYVTFSSGVISFEMKILFAAAPPAPTWDDSMDDDGNYKQSYFKLTLPQLDFDVYACASITEEMQINMRSGACIGCTFTVQVDWDDYKKNFYDSEGRFLPHGEQRNLEKYPDSSTGNITLIVQKDLETFGTIMPNIYQQPQTGDDFVILGISLPKSYITNAEEELDDASKSYMLENNVYYFEYPLKFDEKFLTDNDYILSQIRNNAIVRFLYYDTELELFVSQLSVKYGESPLPQYSITLTDNIEVVLNQIGQVTENVEHVSSLLALLRQTYSNSVWSELADKVSKTYDNVLQGVTTFLKGIKIGTLFGITEQGDATLNDVTANSIHHPEGKWNIDGDGGANFQDISSNKLNTNEISTQKITANEAHFFNLVIDEVKSVGGQIVVSPANAEIIKVVETNDSYVCYFKAVDQDGNGIDNQFVANDLALHMEFNVSDNGTRNYWRRVVSVVSNTNTDVDGVNILCHAVRLSKSDCKTNSAAPQVGDRIVVFGNTTDTSRRNAIVISAYNIPFIDSLPFMGDADGIQAPLFVEYTGVGSWTNPEDKFKVKDANRKNVIARNGTRLRGDFQVLSEGIYTDIKNYIASSSLTVANNAIVASVSSGVLKNSTTGIGGRNLIVNGDMEVWQNNVPKWFAAVNNTQSGATTFTKVTSNLPSGFSTGVAVVCQYSYDGLACGTWGVPPQPNFPIVSGKVYTFSFYVKTENGSRLYVELDTAVSNIPTTSEWERKSFTFTATDEDDKNIRITILCMSADTMYLTGLQIEEGDIMTAWKPAKEDTDNAFSNVDRAISDINDTTNVLEGDVEEISGRDNANVIPQSTFPYGQDSAKKWWSSLGSRARTSDGESAGVNYWMQEDATCGVSSDSTMGACLYAKEIFPSDYIYYDVIAEKTLVTSAGVENLVLEHGAWYTLSWWQKCVSGAASGFCAYWLHDKAEKIYIDGVASESWKNVDYFAPSYSDTDEWVRHTITFKTRAAWVSGETVSIEWRLHLIDTTSVQTPTEYWITRVQLEKGKKATEWKPAGEDLENRIHNTEGQIDIKADEINGTITNLNNGLEIAGVHVDATTPNNSEIRLKANKVKIQTYTEDSGATDTLFTTVEEEVEEGGQTVTKHRAMVKTDYVQATEVVTKGLQAQTIDAENGTIENLNVTNAYVSGELQSTTGNIGGFEIGSTNLVATDSGGKGIMTLQSKFINFTDPRYSGTGITIGLGAVPSYMGGDMYTLLAANVTRTYTGTTYGNVGMYLNVQGSTKSDSSSSGYSGNHALYIPYGDICGLRLFVKRKGSDYTLTRMDTVILATASITLTLPSNAEDGQMYIIRIAGRYRVTLNVNSSSSDSLSLNGEKNTSKKSETWTTGYGRLVIYDSKNKVWQYMLLNNG